MKFQSGDIVQLKSGGLIMTIENIDDDLLDESNYHFDKLLDIIQKNPFATIKIKINGKEIIDLDVNEMKKRYYEAFPKMMGEV